MIRSALDAVLRHVGPREFGVWVDDARLLLPRDLRGRIRAPRSRRGGFLFERPAVRGLQSVVKPGSVVFDVGCSYGLLTCLLARMVGPEGRVHAFEANGAVVEWARRIIDLNCPPGQVPLVHACAGERSGGSARFFSVPGAASVASTRNPEIRHFHAEAVAAEVPLLALDDYCRDLGGAPGCLKIDVEGSECLVLRGASRLLEEARPAMVIETHGLEIEGIGGSLTELLEILTRHSYRLTDLIQERSTTAGEYALRYQKEIGYLLAL